MVVCEVFERVREGPDKVGRRQGKSERMDLADDLHEKGGNERARSPATLKCGSKCGSVCDVCLDGSRMTGLSRG